MEYSRDLPPKEKERLFREEMATWRNPELKVKRKPKAPEPHKQPSYIEPRLGTVKPLKLVKPPKPRAPRPVLPKRVLSRAQGWNLDRLYQQYLLLDEKEECLPFKLGDEVFWARSVFVKGVERMNTFKASLRRDGRYYASVNIHGYWKHYSSRHDTVHEVIMDVKGRMYKYLCSIADEDLLATDVEMFRTYLAQHYNMMHDEE